MSDLNHIDLKAIPEHIAIIMDGNGRWAKSKGEDRLYGHSKGVDAVRETLKAAADLKVKYLTLYAFSTENWNRPKEEVEGLMNLLVMSLANELDELNENGVRLQAKQAIPEERVGGIRAAAGHPDHVHRHRVRVLRRLPEDDGEDPQDGPLRHLRPRVGPGSHLGVPPDLSTRRSTGIGLAGRFGGLRAR